jgi:hypothetical protein
MKKPVNIIKTIAFILLILAVSACKEDRDLNYRNEFSCAYCGKIFPDSDPDRECPLIIINGSESDRRGGARPREDYNNTKKESEKKSSLKVSELGCRLCSLRCYSNFKNAFYPQYRDSIFGSKRERINVWILNKKRKSIQDY